MDKKTLKIALIVVASVLALVILLLLFGKMTSFESRLKAALDYDELLLRHENYGLVRIDEDSAAFVYVPGSGQMNSRLPIYVEFDLDTMSVVDEFYTWLSGSPFRNEFAENARRNQYAFRTFINVKRGRPTHNFYMGISDVEPSYELIGEGASELQYVEINDMYFFMYLIDFHLDM